MQIYPSDITLQTSILICLSTAWDNILVASVFIIPTNKACRKIFQKPERNALERNLLTYKVSDVPGSFCITANSPKEGMGRMRER